jgi:hypothetical protein
MHDVGYPALYPREASSAREESRDGGT